MADYNSALLPRHKANWRTLDPGARSSLSAFARARYSNLTDEGDLDAGMDQRIAGDRRQVIPWLDAALPLQGARVLEIGCGSGESTLALAEQGAVVSGIDVDADALAVGIERCRVYGLPVDLREANVVDLPGLFPGAVFDMVIFFASLEHMTLDERLAAIAASWARVRPGGCWVIIEAPNRLWFHDGHTAFENFYHWLPDDLAVRWGARSRRAVFAKECAAGFDAVRLARWGRGVSYHDIECVLGAASALDVVSNKKDFLARHSPFRTALDLVSQARRYERFLERLEPGINPGFFKQYLDIIVRKPTTA